MYDLSLWDLFTWDYAAEKQNLSKFQLLTVIWIYSIEVDQRSSKSVWFRYSGWQRKYNIKNCAIKIRITAVEMQIKKGIDPVVSLPIVIW